MTLLLLVLVVAVVFVVAAGARHAKPTPTEVAWLAGPDLSRAGDAPDDDAATVCRRYLTRHRRHRLTGGLFGVLFAVIVGVRWSGSVRIGIGQGSPLADVLFCGVCGVVIGSLSAESFRLSPSSNTRSAASLSPRERLDGSERIARSRLIAVAATVIGIWTALADHGSLALVTSLVLIIPLAFAEVVMTVIVGRSRPAMTDRARLLDERLRAFAGASLSYLHLATTSLMLGWTASKIDALTGLLAFLRFLLVIGCLVFAIVMLRRAAPRPNDRTFVSTGIALA